MIDRYAVEYKQAITRYPVTAVYTTLERAAQAARTILDERRNAKDTVSVSKVTYPFNEDEIKKMSVYEHARLETSLVAKKPNTSSYVWCEWLHTRDDLNKLCGDTAEKTPHKPKKNKDAQER